MLPCCSDESYCELLNGISKRDHEVFANDLMLFLCQECKVLWQPLCCGTYVLHSMSPLSDDLCELIRKYYRRFYARFELHYHEMEAWTEDFEDDTQMLQSYMTIIKHRMQQITQFYENDDFNLFLQIISAAVYCIVLYERGVYDAMSYGVIALTETMEDIIIITDRSFDMILEHMSCSLKTFPVLNQQLTTNTNNLHEKFAYDLLSFLCDKSGIPWLQPDLEAYEIHPKSPLTEPIRQTIEKILIRCGNIGIETLLKVFRTENVLEFFSAKIMDILEDVAETHVPHDKSVMSLLEHIVKAARTIAELQKHGTPEVLRIMIQEFSKALNNCNKRNKGWIFDFFAVEAEMNINSAMRTEHSF